MEDLFIPYLIMCLTSLMCVVLGYKLLNPKNNVYINLFYLGFVAFFLGRFYEISRIILDLKVHETFIMTFVVTIGALSFWLSANFAIRQQVKTKARKADIIKCVIFSAIVCLSYPIMANGALMSDGSMDEWERIVGLIITIYSAANIFYHARHLLLIRDDKTNFLRNLKSYNILGLSFYILIQLFAISFAYGNFMFLLVTSVLTSANMVLMLLAFMRGVKNGNK